MTETSKAPHFDVAAYALGALDPKEDEAFRAHLDSCPTCWTELESFVDVTSLLSKVDPAEVLAASEPPSSRVLDGLLDEVRDSRRQARQRTILSAAAAVTLIVGGPLVAGAVFGGQDPRPAQTQAAAPALAGTIVSAVNPVNGTSARVGLEPKLWGTQIGLELSGVRGPLQCELVAVSKAGERSVVTSWSVPPKGYGTPENPKPLTSMGGAAFSPAQIDHLEVRTTPDRARLVTIPTGT
jgi:Putative zinc-finger